VTKRTKPIVIFLTLPENTNRVSPFSLICLRGCDPIRVQYLILSCKPLIFFKFSLYVDVLYGIKQTTVTGIYCIRLQKVRGPKYILLESGTMAP